MADDLQLLRRYAELRDEAAFAALAERHVALVYSAALRQLGGAVHRAEDVTQTVFIELARQAAGLARRDDIVGWLYTTTHHTAAKLKRTEARRQRREQEAHTMNEPSSVPGAVTDWAQLRPVLDDAMQQLSEPDRRAILLRFFKNERLAEVGRQLGLSDDAARMRVERALEKLHILLERRGVTSTASALAAALANQAVANAPAGLAASVTGGAVAGVSAGNAVATWFTVGAARKFATLATAGAVLLMASVWIYEAREARAAEALLAKQRGEIFALALRAERLERETRVAMSRAPAPAGAHAVEAAAAVPIEEEVRGPFGPEPPGSRARGRALMEAYPEIRRLLVEERRAFFAAHYEKLYRELGLTPAQTEAFEMIMIAGVSDTYGAKDKSETVTLDPAPRLPPGEKDHRLRELLGERGFQRLGEFQRSPRDNRVTQLASALYFTDTPLTAEQGAQLQRVLTDCNRAGFDRPPTEYWADAAARAQPFLTTLQLAALLRLQAVDEFNHARMQNQKLRASATATTTK